MDRLVGYIHGQELLDTHLNKTYWFDTWTDLMLDTYMDKNSWITHISKTFWICYRDRLVGYLHEQ